MKKIISVFLAFIISVSLISVYAEEPTEYIVKLKDNVDISRSAKLYLETVSEEWDIYKISSDKLNSVDMNMVECIQKDFVVELLDYIPDDPVYSKQKNYSDLINAPFAWKYGVLGEKVKVGIIDSGINTEHEDLVDNIVKAEDTIGSGSLIDDTPHGSSVAGIVGAEMNNGIGVAGVSQADIYMYKVFKSGKTSVAKIINAFSDAVNTDKCDVINMSIGITLEDESELYEGDMAVFKAAIDKAIEQGVIVVAAAGNSGDKNNPLMYPAGFDEVISVAAVDWEGQYTYFSEYNDKVDVAAPGSSVYTTTDKGYGYVNGTSFASPYVAAAAAIVKGINPAINAEIFGEMIKLTSRDAGDDGYDVHYGWGILDVRKLVELAWATAGGLHISNVSYDASFDGASVSYYNAGLPMEDEVYIRLAVYDENDRLVYLSSARDLNIDEAVEKTLYFSGVDVPEDGCIKVFTLNKNGFMIPVLGVAEYRE